MKTKFNIGDLIINKHNKMAYILEINTGLDSITLVPLNYINRNGALETSSKANINRWIEGGTIQYLPIRISENK